MHRAVALVFLLLTLQSYAQRETSQWFYNQSRAIVSPTGVTTGQPYPNILEPFFNVPVASTSISDAAGNLLFATTGATIINRDLQIMPALTGRINLGGSEAKVLIHQIPATTRYLVFYHVPNPYTVYSNRSWTLKYAIVDMSLNGGRGDVTLYDQVIETVSSPSFAIIDGDQADEAWLVTHRHATDSFFTYRLGATGLSNTPVLSKAGTNVVAQDYIFRDLKASFDGNMIAGYAYRDYTQIFALTYSFIEVFNFDGATGRLTPKTRTPRVWGYFKTNWSLEFSPDSRLLYALHITRVDGLQPCGFGSGEIIQYNPCYTDTSDFYHYSMTIASDFRFCGPFATWGRMLLGADKKLHTPFSGTMVSQVTKPNRIGSAAGFVFDAYRVGTGNNQSPGTPVFNPVVMKRAVQNNIAWDGGCFRNPFFFRITNPRVVNLSWDFGDPSSGAGNTSTQVRPTHAFTAPGWYRVTARFLDPETNQSETLVDSVEVLSAGLRLLEGYPRDTVVCGRNNAFTIQLKGYNSIFHWYRRTETGEKFDRRTSDSLRIESTGTWYVERRQNGCSGCTLIDSITVTMVDNDGNLGSDRFLCAGDSISLSVPESNGARFTWNTGDTGNRITVRSPGTYWLQADYAGNGCSFRDTIVISRAIPINAQLPGDTTLCSGESLVLNASVPNSYSQWQDGSYQPSYTVRSAGLYWVQVTSFEGCSIRDSIRVDFVPATKPDIGSDTALCLGDALTLRTSLRGDYLWSTGASSQNITVTASGNYWLRVDNGACATGDTIAVVFNPPPMLNLGTDTVLCAGNAFTLDPGITGAAYRWQDGSAGPSYTVNQAGIYWLQVEKDQCRVGDTIQVQYHTVPSLDLGPDIRFCAGDSALLDAGPGFSTYAWSTGQETRTLQVSSAGTYVMTALTQEGCQVRDSVQVGSPFPLPQPELGDSGPLCAGSNATLDAGAGYVVYTWNTGSMTRSINVSQAGFYRVAVTDANGCDGTDSLTITELLPLPSNFLPADTSFCSYGSVELAPGGAYRQYLWSTGQSTQRISVTRAGTYWLQVTDNNNCQGRDSTVVVARDCLTGVWVPNAFTPGGDGVNDFFRPQVSGLLLAYHFNVYNRFGELVFSSTDPLRAWDGTFRGGRQPSGVFTWVFRYQLQGQEPKTEKGTVMLIR